MIIYMDSSTFSIAAQTSLQETDPTLRAAFLTDPDYNLSNSKSVYLVQHFDAPDTQEMFSSEAIVEKLMEHHLQDIENIYLIMSDINPDHSLPDIARHLARDLNHRLHRPIKVHYVSDPHYISTVILPPKSESNPTDKWQIFGHGTPRNEEKHDLLCEKADITDYLNHEQRTCLENSALSKTLYSRTFSLNS